MSVVLEVVGAVEVSGDVVLAFSLQGAILLAASPNDMHQVVHYRVIARLSRLAMEYIGFKEINIASVARLVLGYVCLKNIALLTILNVIDVRDVILNYM